MDNRIIGLNEQIADLNDAEEHLKKTNLIIAKKVPDAK